MLKWNKTNEKLKPSYIIVRDKIYCTYTVRTRTGRNKISVQELEFQLWTETMAET
jgi:hypothetical protein